MWATCVIICTSFSSCSLYDVPRDSRPARWSYFSEFSHELKKTYIDDLVVKRDKLLMVRDGGGMRVLYLAWGLNSNFCSYFWLFIVWSFFCSKSNMWAVSECFRGFPSHSSRRMGGDDTHDDISVILLLDFSFHCVCVSECKDTCGVRASMWLCESVWN